MVDFRENIRHIAGSIDRLNDFLYFCKSKIFGCFLCIHENGFSYTWFHGWRKIGRWLIRYSNARLPYREVRRKQISSIAFQPTKYERPCLSDRPQSLALFAIYAPSGHVPRSTWRYIEGLNKICDNVIVCSDCVIGHEDVEKMKEFASCAEFLRHGEYDFGSYKRAYLMAKKNGYLKRIKWLIMANDSCIGPLFPLSKMMSMMEGVKCDFWGQTSYSFHGRLHLQSYFMVFLPQIVESGVLEDFWGKIGSFKSRAEVISSCEIALSEYLTDKGFSWKSYVPYRAVLKNPTCSPVTLIKKYNTPFVKIKAMLGESFEPLNEVHEIVKNLSPILYEAYLDIADEWTSVAVEEKPYLQ